MRILKMAFLLLLSVPALCMAEPDYLKVGAPLFETRARLIKDKWVPIRFRRPYTGGIWEELSNMHIPELITCTVDTSNCIFFYKKNGKCLELISSGENVKSMEVFQWHFECPYPDEVLRE